MVIWVASLFAVLNRGLAEIVGVVFRGVLFGCIY